MSSDDPTRPIAVRPAVRVDPTGEHPFDDDVCVEEPLEIRVEGRPLAVLMRTPGDDLDLVAGFLFTEGVIDGPDDLTAIAHVDRPGDERGNTVDVRLAAGVEAHRARIERATRDLYATSACGVCGKASIDRLLIATPPRVRVADPSAAFLLSLSPALLAVQASFARTGGQHAAALFDFDGRLDVVREDIGRHNAVDKVLGARLRADRAPVDDRVLFVSGRAGWEIVQKALMARVPVVASVGAASSLAIDLAREGGLALYAFVRERSLNRYA